jgi:hypothetical protein
MGLPPSPRHPVQKVSISSRDTTLDYQNQLNHTEEDLYFLPITQVPMAMKHTLQPTKQAVIADTWV